MNLARPLILASSILASATAFGQNLPEGSYPPVQIGAGADRAVVAQEAARYTRAGRPGLVTGEGRPTFVPVFDAARTVRSDDVRADRDQWNRAGLAELNRGEATPDFGAPTYRAAVTRYEQSTDTAALDGGVRASVRSFGATVLGN